MQQNSEMIPWECHREYLPVKWFPPIPAQFHQFSLQYVIALPRPYLPHNPAVVRAPHRKRSAPTAVPITSASELMPQLS